MALFRYIRDSESIKTEQFSKQAASRDNYIIMSLRRFYRVYEFNKLAKQLLQVLQRSKAEDNSESHIIILYFLCVLYWVLSLFFFFD